MITQGVLPLEMDSPFVENMNIVPDEVLVTSVLAIVFVIMDLTIQPAIHIDMVFVG